MYTNITMKPVLCDDTYIDNTNVSRRNYTIYKKVARDVDVYYNYVCDGFQKW